MRGVCVLSSAWGCLHLDDSSFLYEVHYNLEIPTVLLLSDTQALRSSLDIAWNFLVFKKRQVVMDTSDDEEKTSASRWSQRLSSKTTRNQYNRHFAFDPTPSRIHLLVRAQNLEFSMVPRLTTSSAHSISPHEYRTTW